MDVYPFIGLEVRKFKFLQSMFFLFRFNVLCPSFSNKLEKNSCIIYLFLISLLANYWADKSNRRHFFDDFAASRNFDPLIAENWNSVTYTDIVGVKVCYSLFSFFVSSSLPLPLLIFSIEG